MSRPVTAQIQLKVSWWFKLWIAGLILAAQLSGRVPDPEKVEAMARRGIKVKTKVRQA